MFCKNCGKQIEKGEYCIDCLKQPEEQVVVIDPAVEPKIVKVEAKEQPKISRKIGLKKALTATILGLVGYCIIIYMCQNVLALFDIVLFFDISEQAQEILMWISIVSGIVSIIIGIISLSLGISSIKTFKKSKAQGVKPVATLVLGITAIYLAVSSFVFIITDYVLLIAVLLIL